MHVVDKAYDSLYQRYLRSAFEIEGVMFLYYNDRPGSNPRNPDTELRSWSERAMDSQQNRSLFTEHAAQLEGALMLEIMNTLIVNKQVVHDIERVFETSITDLVKSVVKKDFLDRHPNADDLKVALVDNLLHKATELTLKYND